MEAFWIIFLEITVLITVYFFFASRKKIVTDTPVCTVDQIPLVFDRLKQEGNDGSFAVFMFNTPNDKDGADIQFSIEDGRVGLDWCMIKPANIRDREKVERFIVALGYAVRQLKMNEMKYLRVEQGDLSKLCRKVITDLYAQKPDEKLDLVVEGFSWP